MAAKSRALEKIMARYRHRDLPEPRPRPRPQGSFSRQLQLQKNREGFLRRRHAAAITAARYEAKEAMVKAEVLLDKMKTMEATLSRVAAMLPSLERMQRREDAATAKIQAALRGYAKRKALRSGSQGKREVSTEGCLDFFSPPLPSPLLSALQGAPCSAVAGGYGGSRAQPAGPEY